MESQDCQIVSLRQTRPVRPERAERPTKQHEERPARQESQGTVVPWLSAAPRLIHSLGWCMSFAATREVARIRLSTESLRSTDLSTNLVQIADEGQNAFMDAYSDLLDISNGTRAMTRRGGHFDRLESALGKPDGDRATTRALGRICETVEECERNGKRTAGQFKAWRRTVQNVEQAVVATQRSTENDISNVESSMKALNGELRMHDLLLEQKTNELRGAKEEYHRILELHDKREEALQGYTDNAINCAALGFTAGMFGALVGATGSAVLLAVSSKRALTLESEVQHKAQVFYDLKEEMARVRNLLSGKESDEERLKKMAQIIIIVCRLLRGLCDDILVLLTQFERLHSTIKQLVREHKEAKETVRDLQIDLEDGIDDGEETPQMNQHDYNVFQDQMLQMRKLSVEISSMSSLYADVIVDVINPGFSKVVEAAYEDGGGNDLSVVIYNKQSGMNDYLEEAQRTCVERERAADAALRQELANIDGAYNSQRNQRRNEASRHAKKKKRGSKANMNNSSGPNIFSKFFHRGSR